MKKAEKTDQNDAAYSQVGEYEASVCLIEILRYCSDADHPMSISEISWRCQRLTGNELHPKMMRQTLKKLTADQALLEWMHGGWIVETDAEENGRKFHRYFWMKNKKSRQIEHFLRDKIRTERPNPVWKELLDCLGLGAELANENGWRKKAQWSARRDEAGYIDVRTPYTQKIYEREECMGIYEEPAGKECI